MDLIALLIAGLVLLVVYLWYRGTDSTLPPCPMRPLPIVGNLFHMSRDTRTQFKEWRERCGDIYSLYLGSSLVVVLNGYDLIKEALVKKADVFSDRPPFFMDTITGYPGHGVIFSNGNIWKEQRSVSLSILRVFGMGKNVLAEKIEEEVTNYVGFLRSLNGKPTDIRVMTNISTSNIICSILIGHRFGYDDHEFQDLMHKLGSTATDQQNVSLINILPWLKYLPGDFFLAKQLERNVLAIFDLLRKFINEKSRHIEDANEVNNLIDAYFIERNKKIQAGITTTLDDESLIHIMNDLFIAGTETTSTTIYWCVLYLLHNPEVQEKVYTEIKEKVGTDRTPTIQDRLHLNYINALIAETQRLASIVPHGLAHMCSEKVTLSGYTLPKGTVIFPNLDSILHDKDIWGDDALDFRPERFIDNGKLKVPEQFIPFSAGRRVCLGEAIAKMELFLFLSSMLQKFKFLPPTPNSIPPLNYHCGVVIAPKPYEVRVIERN